MSSIDGDLDGDGDLDQIFAYGGRSFSIFDENGNLVFDSGSQLEEITAAAFPADFNATNDENDSFENRSDNKGPEPEGVTLGEVAGKTYAFVGLERIGGVVVYDISNPAESQFVEYINTRDFAGDAEAGTAGDLGPEGLTFISANDSPNGNPLLAVSNEVSGSTTIFEVTTSGGSGSGDEDVLLFGNGQVLTLVGGGGDDGLYGSDRDETFLAGAGNDKVFSNGGLDIIDSGAGLDKVWLGGMGKATVILSEGEGYDFIANYQMGMTQLKGFDAAELTLKDGAQGAEIFKGDDKLAIVAWKTVSDLSGSFVA